MTDPAFANPHETSFNSLKTEADKLKTTVLSEAGETGTKIKEETKAAVSSLREAGLRYAAAQKDALSQKAGEYAEAVSAVSDKLKEAGEPNLLAGPAGTAGDQLGQLARYLRESSPEEIMRGAGDLARRRPELFFGGLFLAGLIGARFLKASGTPRLSGTGAAPLGGSKSLTDFRPL